MKIDLDENNNRRLILSNIDGELAELTIAVDYYGDANAQKAATLDKVVMPLIRKGLQLAEMFKDTDISEVQEMLRIHNQFRWFLYDEKSAIPDMAIILDDKPTLAEALAGAYDYLKSYRG